MSDFAPATLIDREHNVSTFDCGKPSLNDFLQRNALDKQNARLSRTYVVTKDSLVVAYYTLAHVSVVREAAPKRFGRGMPGEIPALLIARLAVDILVQGYGLGRSLLTDALRKTWSVMESDAVPVRLFVVDAMDDDAKAFYERFEMTPSPVDPMRLFLLYKDLRAIYDEST